MNSILCPQSRILKCTKSAQEFCLMCNIFLYDFRWMNYEITVYLTSKFNYTDKNLYIIK